MFVFKAAIKIIVNKWVRILLFITIMAALTFSFGMLGRGILYGDKITDPLTVIIVDYDNSTESRMFTQMFMDYELYENILRFSINTEESALKSLRNNEAAAILKLPEGFAENVKNGSNEPFIVVLNEAQFLKKTLVEYFAEAFADILAGSQSGVYAALDFTYINYPESYGRMFTISNLRFLNLVLNRQDMLKTKTVSAVSGIPVLTHFIFSFWIFINFAGMVLFIDIINTNFNAFIIKKLHLTGANMFLFTLQLVLAFFTVFLIINAALLLPAFSFLSLPSVSLPFITGVLLMLFCVSGLTVFISLMFKNSQTACILVSVFSLISLFLSGGVIPRDFFTPLIKNFSFATLNFWVYESVTGAFLENIKSVGTLTVILLTLLFYLLSVLKNYYNAGSKL